MAACPIELARYTQPESGWELEFRPVMPEDGIVSNAFRLIWPNGQGTFEGAVRRNNGETRPDGFVTYRCPEDPTDEQIKACTGWSGVMYGITGAKVEMLASGGDTAPDQVLLAGLGRDMNYSGIFYEAQLGEVPWDVFSLAGCME